MAQIPTGYYDAANGQSGTTLKASLNDIIDGHTELSYSACWDALKVTDRDPNNPSNVIGIYSRFSMNAALEYDNGQGWNREHVWAKSRGDFDIRTFEIKAAPINPEIELRPGMSILIDYSQFSN